MLSPKAHIMTRGNTSGRRRERWLILKSGSCDLDINRLVIIPESTCYLEQEEKKPNKQNGYDKVWFSFQTLRVMTQHKKVVQGVCAHLQGGRTSVSGKQIYS